LLQLNELNDDSKKVGLLADNSLKQAAEPSEEWRFSLPPGKDCSRLLRVESLRLKKLNEEEINFMP